MTDPQHAAREARVTALFAAWSSGDLDAPPQYLVDEPVLEDSVGGRYEGWGAIRAYFGHGLAATPIWHSNPQASSGIGRTASR